VIGSWTSSLIGSASSMPLRPSFQPVFSRKREVEVAQSGPGRDGRRSRKVAQPAEGVATELGRFPCLNEKVRAKDYRDKLDCIC
jgi:hypothetical protein